MPPLMNKPDYFDLLNEDDRSGYISLQKTLSSTECRNCRNKRLNNFSDMLDIIHNYTYHGDENDWKRYLVCGVCWVSDGIAINTHQLSILLGKCKSSINGSFQRLEYAPFPCSAAASKELIEIIPHLKVNYSELRQWTLRKRISLTPKIEMKPMQEATFKTPQPELSINDPYPLPNMSGLDDFGFFDDPFMVPINGWSDESPKHKNEEKSIDLDNPFPDFV